MVMRGWPVYKVANSFGGYVSVSILNGLKDLSPASDAINPCPSQGNNHSEHRSTTQLSKSRFMHTNGACVAKFDA